MNVDRRKFSMSTVAALAVLLGCDSEQKPASTATLFNNADVQTAMKSLSAAIQELQANIGDFETENWKQVVPEVRDCGAEVDSAFYALRKALGVANI